MNYRAVLNQPKESVIIKEINSLMTFKSYKERNRCAATQAEKNHKQACRVLNQRRYWKVIEQGGKHPTIFWSRNGSLTMLYWPKTGDWMFDDEIKGKLNFCRVIGAGSDNWEAKEASIVELLNEYK